MDIKKDKFELVSDYILSGDQPKAVEKICSQINCNKQNMTIKGVTGSGKTFTMANIIAKCNRPSLIMVHNKTLAAQIFEELKSYFPNNAVEYFVSYYDYYQPEAYIPRTDTYIEKDSAINEHIDLMRHSATRSLLERQDTIVVSSISCIYGLGSPINYSDMTIGIKKGDRISLNHVVTRFIDLQYERNEVEFTRGKFRVRGDNIDIIPSYSSKVGVRITFFGNEIEALYEIDPLTGNKIRSLNSLTIFPNSHFVTPRNVIIDAIKYIKAELEVRLKYLYSENKLVEAQRLEQRTNYDIEMLLQTGSCKGIENYSRYLNNLKEGDPPPTLFQYLPQNALLFIDESHVTTPQIRAMYNGDRARKLNLVDFGFRLPSALDNRPLKFEEWEKMKPTTIFVSATPSQYEIESSDFEVIEQIIRPTGLVDPVCIIKPAINQVDDLVIEIKNNIKNNEKVLVTTLTKKMSEDLTEYLTDQDIKVSYLHSEINTLERLEIIADLRKGNIDVIVGINLLREGIDIPECSLVAILDADKEGFLRSETALIQTIGRAARNKNGRVILYADKKTDSIERALNETNRRRIIQMQYNKDHNIQPQTIIKTIKDEFYSKMLVNEDSNISISDYKNIDKISNKIATLKKQMLKEAKELNFEKAASIRDMISALERIADANN